MSRVRATAVSIAVVAAVTLAMHASAGAAPTSAGGLPSASILFQRGEHLFVARGDGSHARLLVKKAGQPAVSPDAQRILFVRAGSRGSRSIWLMSRDGSRQRRLTRGPEAISPAWSPDGRTVYFSRYVLERDRRGKFAGYAWAIFRMHADGSRVQRLTHPTPTDHGTCHEGPRPSPDGQVIAYSDIGDCDHGSQPTVEAIDSSGGEATLGRFDVDGGFDPAWSPDGRELAFASVDEWGGGSGIKVASSDGAKARAVYRRGPASSPAWSPDGEWLVFSTDGNVWLVRADGSALRRVLKTGVWRSNPAWLPRHG